MVLNLFVTKKSEVLAVGGGSTDGGTSLSSSVLC